MMYRSSRYPSSSILFFFLFCLVETDDGVLLLYSRRSSMRVFHDLPYTKKLSIAPGQRT